MCYIHSTIDQKLQAFVGDNIVDCKLWPFADAAHAGEYNNRCTSGCILILVGPKTYFPSIAFSKKQTSVSLLSTESEVTSANVSLRSVGLPSSGLGAHLQNAGGITPSPTQQLKTGQSSGSEGPLLNALLPRREWQQIRTRAGITGHMTQHFSRESTKPLDLT